MAETLLTPEQLRAIFPRCDAPLWAPVISDAWREFGVTALYARAGHLGIVGNETGGLVATAREDMRYSPERAFELFPKARKHPAITRDRCSTVPRDKGRRFASWIYGDLYGNGPESTEDGWRYRGGGITGITFRYTYRICGRALGVDLESDPDRIAEPRTSARAAAWFIAALRPDCLRLLNRPGEGDFLIAANMVGWSDPVATQRRLDFRRRALDVFGGVAGDSGLIRYGDTGARVVVLQQALRRAGATNIAIDGDYGPYTWAAVIAFQKLHGLAADGIVGPRTRLALGIGNGAAGAPPRPAMERAA